MYINLIKIARYSSQILLKMKFLNRFSKYPQVSNFMKIRNVAADLFQAHIRTDVRRAEMTNPIAVFRNFVDKAKNCKLYLVSYSKIQTFNIRVLYVTV